jgi:hypothetical protein
MCACMYSYTYMHVHSRVQAGVCVEGGMLTTNIVLRAMCVCLWDLLNVCGIC